jgi:maltose alpha-D-glucosyltransferase/alpha-amylase
MIRSFHYAALTALLESSVVRVEDRPLAAPWAEAWHRSVSAAFLRTYLDITAGAAFRPTPEDLRIMLDMHLLRKAFHELEDELDRCAETVIIPLTAILELAGGIGS